MNSRTRGQAKPSQRPQGPPPSCHYSYIYAPSVHVVTSSYISSSRLHVQERCTSLMIIVGILHQGCDQKKKTGESPVISGCNNRDFFSGITTISTAGRINKLVKSEKILLTWFKYWWQPGIGDPHVISMCRAHYMLQVPVETIHQ